MTPSISDIHSAIYDSLSPFVTNQAMIRQDQEGYAQWPSFVTWRIKHWEQSGQSLNKPVDPITGIRDLTSHWKICVEFMSTGVDSESLMLSLSNTIANKYTAIESLKAFGLGFLYKEQMRSAPKLLPSGGWEIHHVMNAYFNLVITDTDDVGVIESVELESTLLDDYPNIIYHSVDIIDSTP
jgi:hypothetical protein